ncbi:Hypothetical protein NTJ_11493 [Nesidiocoris tenuis]|uniref:Uncharacterized protein n=1 Tax=Nesidiocoris tenuis TaxID=355587 RepID=A0ABN7B7B6_9HEMI|nr:Hypothetical protein NTJ_11493 [Nesidiocoris tenuis]
MLMDASLSEYIAFSKESTRLEAESDVKFETDRKDFSKAITVMEAGISNSKQTMNGRSKKSNVTSQMLKRCPVFSKGNYNYDNTGAVDSEEV